MVQRSTSPGAGSSASPSNTFGSAVAAGVDDDPIVDDFPVEADREQEAALAARIAELSQDFLADSGVGLAPEIFDRMCEGFVTLQDAYVAEAQQFAARAVGSAKAPVLRALSNMRFQNAGLRTQLEKNRVGAKMIAEQNRVQLEALRRQFREGGRASELQPAALPASRRHARGDAADASAPELQPTTDPRQARAEAQGSHEEEEEQAGPRQAALDAASQRATELAAELRRAEAAHAAMVRELSEAQAREAALAAQNAQMETAAAEGSKLKLELQAAMKSRLGLGFGLGLGLGLGFEP